MQNRTNREAELVIVSFLIMIVAWVAFLKTLFVVLPRLLWVSPSAMQKDVKTLSWPGERLIIFHTAGEGSRPGRPPAGCTPAPHRDAAAPHGLRSPVPRQSPRCPALGNRRADRTGEIYVPARSPGL